MSEPYIGEIRMFGGFFAPAGWSTCQGQILPIDQNDALFALIGTTYGGDGQTTFGLPDLQGRVPMHVGSGFVLGQKAGVESVTLTVQQMPIHSHAIQSDGRGGGDTNVPALNTVLADEGPPGTQQVFTYKPPGGTQVQMSANSIGTSGGSQPHDNMQPYLGVTYILSLFGVFPSQN